MANQRAASRRLKDIAEEYTSNELMNLNLIRVKEQSEKAFEIVVKDENGEEITIRMEAYGKGSSVRGLNNKDRRPDIILIDDPALFGSSTIWKTWSIVPLPLIYAEFA